MLASAFRGPQAAACVVAQPARRSSRPNGVSHPRLRLILALTVWLGADVAYAQISGSFSLVSDYRFRGVTLSDGKPAAQGALNYDHSSGLYLGLFASTVRLATNDATGLQAVGQAGYAIRATPEVTWDVGAFYSAFSNPSALNYADFYVGAAGTEWSARVSYSPRYFGQPYSATYAELNLTPFSDHWLVPLLHVGLLSASPELPSGVRTRWDGRVGVAYSYEFLTLQASWVTTSRTQEYPAGQSKSGWVIRATAWY